MAIKKRAIKSTGEVKCTFRLPKEAASQAEKVVIVGEFNDWSTTSHPMNKLKSGEFKLDLSLQPGRDYQFRYLIDDQVWENDWDADGYYPSDAVSAENSVVSV